MNRPAVLFIIFFLAVLAIGAFLLRSESGEPIQASLALAEALGGDTTGYARADTVRALVFPDDYGPHPTFKSEWWYYTGNLGAGVARFLEQQPS